MRNFVLLFGLIVSLNSFAGECILNKAAVGQDIDMSELGDEMNDLIAENNPKCDFKTKEQCEAYQMTNLFNIEVSPCIWVEKKTIKNNQGKKITNLNCIKTAMNKVRCDDDKTYKLVEEVDPRDFSKLVDQLNDLGSHADKHYWPHPATVGNGFGAFRGMDDFPTRGTEESDIYNLEASGATQE